MKLVMTTVASTIKAFFIVRSFVILFLGDCEGYKPKVSRLYVRSFKMFQTNC